MKIPTIKKTNEELEKKFLKPLESIASWYEQIDKSYNYDVRSMPTDVGNTFFQVGELLRTVERTKQFYQDKMLKMLEYLDMEELVLPELEEFEVRTQRDLEEVGLRGKTIGYNQAVKELKEKIGKVKGS